MKAFFAVAIAGAIGSVARYGVAIAMRTAAARGAVPDGWPIGTFIVNIVGCFLIGVFLRTTADGTVTRTALTVGLCGGFTTFSAFSVETLAMVEQGRPVRALVYVGASVMLGVVATAVGMRVGAAR